MCVCVVNECHKIIRAYKYNAALLSEDRSDRIKMINGEVRNQTSPDVQSGVSMHLQMYIGGAPCIQ